MQKLARSHPAASQWPAIDMSGPGTILADFELLLDFVGVTGIKTGGKNHRLPLAALKDLDERMTQPLRPNLNRPQQLSYPHLNGLYLLLRATGLGVSSGQGESGRLSVSPKRHAEWNSLNPEEQYFTLADAMLRASWDIIQSDQSSTAGPWRELEWRLDGLCKDRWPANNTGIRASELFYSWQCQTTVALLELLGVLEIPRVSPQSGESWRLATVRTTEFGRAFLGKFREVRSFFSMIEFGNRKRDRKHKWLGELFRAHYPNCRKTLPDHDAEFVDGVWQFKVSLGNVWRRIVIPAEARADDLIAGILTEIKFDFDHLYQLQVRNRSGRNITIGHPALEEAEYHTDEFPIGLLPLDPGQSMTLLYDFGDCWTFAIGLEKILPPDDSVTKMKVVGKKGKPPDQYGDLNDDW